MFGAQVGFEAAGNKGETAATEGHGVTRTLVTLDQRKRAT